LHTYESSSLIFNPSNDDLDCSCFRLEECLESFLCFLEFVSVGYQPFGIY